MKLYKIEYFFNVLGPFYVLADSRSSAIHMAKTAFIDIFGEDKDRAEEIKSIQWLADSETEDMPAPQGRLILE